VTSRDQFIVVSSRVGYDGSLHMRDEERRVERKKPARKRGPETKKGIWTAVKDNAALVTVIGALLGVLTTGAINTYITNKDHAAQLELEREKAQDAALQTYLDQMGQMLLNQDLRSSEADSDLRTLARARTLTTLRALEDAGRKTQVLRFLVEANLVQGEYESSPVISLAHADLSGTDLSDANLSDADLVHADLSDADLSGTDLSDADLSFADLSDANLSFADLSFADLSDAILLRAYLGDADLGDANLSFTDLSDTDLSFADLSDADLRGAILRDATGVDEEQLEVQTDLLHDAIMPDGSKHP
jgi:uncharacterized protein YjbI with pentapeptide repeats